MHSNVPSTSWLGKSFFFSWFATALGGRVYLSLALVLNIILLFLRQAPAWLKALVWVLFVVAVFGLLGVEADLRHVRQ